MDSKEKIKDFFTNAMEVIVRIAIILLLITALAFLSSADEKLTDLNIRISNEYDSTIETGLTITEKKIDEYTVYINGKKESNFNVFGVNQNKYYIYTDKKEKKIYLINKWSFL